jgi:4-amino-4-deoxy-L-arabinose transferase-like glycosyltransferase
MVLSGTVQVSDRAEAAGRLGAVRRGLGAMPLPLAALLGLVAIFGVTWALVVPPGQSPDSTSHFAYAQSLGENFALPGNPRLQSISTDEKQAIIADNVNVVTSSPYTVKPSWSAADYRSYLAEVAHTHPSRADGGGPSTAAPNPPLYYLFADLAYWADSGGNAFSRMYAIQIWGVALLLLSVTGGWLLAGEVLGRRRLPQLAGAAVVGLEPMATFLSTSITPDAMLMTLWTLGLWLGARVINRSARPLDAAALCAITAAAILTKATSYALLPAVLFALVVGWWRRPKEERTAALRRLAPALVVLAVPVLAWVEYSRTNGRSPVNVVAPSVTGAPVSVNVRQFLSYVWQFYLPRLPFQRPPIAEGGAYYTIWLREGWATFGWLDVQIVSWVYSLIGWICAVFLVMGAALLTRIRGVRKLSLLAFFALALVGLVGLLHVTDYLTIISSGYALFQGRYLLPVIGLFGLIVAFVVSRLPPRLRAPACGAILAGLLVLQVLSLGTVAETYYT